MNALPRWKPLSASSLALLIACSGGSGTALIPHLAPAASTFAQRATRAPLQVRIRIPMKRRIAQARQAPAFVSPSTQGMTIAITGPRGFHASVVAGLTPSSPGCIARAGATACTLSAGLLSACVKRNCYAAAIKTYDVVSCTTTCTIPRGARELSAAQNVAFDVAAGTTNNLTFTLGGIPQSLSVL